jgi:hypothetical protein
MQLRHLVRPWAARAVVASAALFAARSASARTCAADSDCPRGFRCTGSQTEADGAVVGMCLSIQCQSDSDCDVGLRCDFGLGTVCVQEPDGGQSCQPNDVCAPGWQPPCTSDNDCGPGFTCSGGGGYTQCPRAGIDASVPPYATATSIACADVPKPPFPPVCGAPDSGLAPDAGLPFCIPPLCDGGTCLSVSWKTCQQQPTPPCTVDSDCPSTWTCRCGATCGGGFIPAGGTEAGGQDSGCTLTCTPPNSDLSNGGTGLVCAGAAGGAVVVPNGGLAAGGGGGGGGGGGAGAAPVEAGAPEAGAPTGNAAANGGGGCHISPARNDFATWFCLAVAVAGAVALRRRRAINAARR